MTDDEVASFLRGPHSLALTTIGKDGWPHMTAMRYGFLDDRIALSTYERSQKVRNLQRTNRFGALIETGSRYADMVGVSLAGTVRFEHDEDVVRAVNLSIVERYPEPGEDDDRRALAASSAAKRVVLVLDVARTTTWMHSKLGGVH